MMLSAVKNRGHYNTMQINTVVAAVFNRGQQR